MRTKELAEIYAEVDDFLGDELNEFLDFLEGMGYLNIEFINKENKSWKKIIEEYLG